MIEMQEQDVMGRIFNIQRFCVHDGPGIRTTIFFKGCPLRCIWCHNPEGLSEDFQLSFKKDSCSQCGRCIDACEHNVHEITDEKIHLLDRSQCVLCQNCIEACLNDALELIGKDMTISEIIDEVLSDSPFYETSGGGVTLSGGEPLYQIEFIEKLLISLKKEGIHTTIETCGNAPWESYERILPYLDLVLIDIKETDPIQHKKYTGVDNILILENLHKIDNRGKKIILRLPIIPGYNDRKDHFESIAQLVKDLSNVIGVEVIPYHRLGIGKYDRIGLDLPDTKLQEIKSPNKELIHKWVDELRKLGIPIINDN